MKSLAKYFFITLFLSTASYTMMAQGSSTSTIPTNPVYMSPVRSSMAPAFDGGIDALSKYLDENLVYPEKARRMGIEGVVHVEYFINTDGSIEDITIVKSLSPEIDREAIRLVKEMPAWLPARQNNQPVRVKYRLPINFQLTL